MNVKKILTIGGMLWIAMLTAAPAQEVGDADEGWELAQLWCAECHDIAGRQTPRIVGAPPSFATVANDPAGTEIWLRTFFVTPHPVMPNIVLTADQTDDMVAYIFSLKVR